ncbi:MAG: hypothetical protein AVDCRST_MAG56-6252 [uncultured Cytophagales bacterium]|uniref:Uncharacterized protein n=1 Tax=uncultured Cytophagales bacterium TaxID=158755 RepID=A0A6J4KPA9_9SPHI|nr:MAG: hypothetical protein AVDCRST_MAG56-6252 [uncultured Cytophagales bacterium]
MDISDKYPPAVIPGGKQSPAKPIFYEYKTCLYLAIRKMYRSDEEPPLSPPCRKAGRGWFFPNT